MVVVGTAIPCSDKKCLVHNTWPIASLTATNSASIELFVLIFCLHDVEYVTPFQMSSLYFACPYGLRKSCLPTTVHCFLVRLSVLVLLCSVSAALPLSISCSHPHWAIVPWYIEMPLLSVCLFSCILTGIAVLPLDDGIAGQ